MTSLQAANRLLLTLFAALSTAAAAEKPNIVFILADDLSFRDLSIYGQTRFETPHLDRLAQTGMRFTQAYAAAPECAPSRGTLLTGLHTGHSRIRTNSSARGQDHLQDEDITIAEVLKSAGYATGMVGKWGVGLPGTPGTPYKQGFDYSFGFYDQARAHTFYPHYLFENDRRIWLEANFGYDLERLYRNNKLEPHSADINRYKANGDLIPVGAADPDNAVYSEALVEEKALDFVRARSEEPFFLYFATQLPHGPVVIDNLGPFMDRPDYPDTKRKEWAAMVTRLDAFTGRLVEELKRLGVYENTLIVFASDNGYAMCGYFGRGNNPTNWPDDPFFRNKGPFRGGKFSVLEGGIRVPFFVHWPKRIEAGVSSVPVWLIDLMPTFAETAGAKIEHRIDGKSLWPLLDGNPADFPSERPFYWEKRREQAVRLGPWKAFRESPDAETELYLIEEDIHGDRNLASSYPDVVERIEKIMIDERTDSEWYWNPQETPEEFKRKQERARELGQEQRNVRGNTVLP